jgi:hypothetical protein
VLRRRAARQPAGKPYPDHREYPACGYAELDLRARAVAARLGSLVPPGSRVLLAFRLGTDFAGALYGCLYAGMAAVPLVLNEPEGPAGSEVSAGSDGSDEAFPVRQAVARSRAHAVLTGGDSWTSLGLDSHRTPVVEADGSRVGGDPVWRLAESWQPVGVLRTAAAYHRYVPDGQLGGRLQRSLDHGELGSVLVELAQDVRRGSAQEDAGRLASVHGVEEAVLRMLLPAYL